MISPELHEQIERFLLGKMSGAELQAFEQRLADEPDVAAEVSLLREVIDALRLADKAAAFRDQLVAIEKKTPSKAAVKLRGSMRRWLALVAGLTFLILATWWISNRQPTANSVSAKILFETYFNPPDKIAIAGTLRNGDATSLVQPPDTSQHWNRLWQELAVLYAQKSFKEAQAVLLQIQALDPKGEYASETFFYAGLLHLQKEDPEGALAAFAKVTVAHTEDRDWYQALALLALDRRAEAKVALEKIAVSPQPRQREAAEMLKQL